MTDVGVARRVLRSTRARFTAAIAALVAAVGALILGVVYLSMRYLPDYRLGGSPGVTALSPTTSRPDLSAALPAPRAAVPLVVESSSDVFNTLLVFSGIALAVLILVGAVGSWFLMGRMLRPLRTLSEAADLARAGSLSHRVGSTSREDEFAAVSGAFDSMLDELERSFAAHQRFAANASHEIRTPLATTRALLEVAATEDLPSSVQLLLERLSGSNDQLIAITDSLLDLASVGRYPLHLSSVPVADLVVAAIAGVERDIVAMGLEVRVASRPAVVEGDRGLITLLAGNLIRNAVRHNVIGGFIAVDVGRYEDGSVRLIVENSGEPIPADAIARLSEPFYRVRVRTADASGRSNGHGLGLAIVAAIVDAHRATLYFSARAAGGLRVTVSFAASAEWDPVSDAPRASAVSVAG